MPKRSRKPQDMNELAKAIVDRATGQDAPPGEAAEPEPLDDDEAARKDAARLLGRRGGLKGGKARADSLTPEERSEIARKAANARWRGKS